MVVNDALGGIWMKNKDVRNAAAGSGVKLWQIADALGIADTTLCRKMRKELPQEDKTRIFDIINALAEEGS